MRVALTGAATGIGAITAAKLKALGHEVIAFDISQPADHVHHWIKTDLSDQASIAAAVNAAEGPFDVLINNAGVPPRPGQTKQVLDINYFGFVAMMDGLMPKLSEGASIVNVASRAGAMWRDNLDEVKALMALDPSMIDTFLTERNIDATRAYNLSKEAVIVLTMARTKEMISRGLRMNSVSPAAVSTGILDDFTAAFGDKVAANIARVGRPGLPEEVADVIVILASPQSHWIKGQDILVDGGIAALAAADMLELPTA